MYYRTNCAFILLAYELSI